MTFGEKVSYVRTKMLLTQTQLAQELGISLATVARWETQKRKPQMVQYGLTIKEERKLLKFLEKLKQAIAIQIIK